MKVLTTFGSLIIAFTMASVQAATFSVNSTADTDDGSCDAANCTLREAITAANANPGADVIDLSAIKGASPVTINILSPLPRIKEAVLMDGSIAENRPDIPGDVVIDPNEVGFEVVGSPSKRPGVVLEGINAVSNDDTADGFYVAPGWQAAQCDVAPNPGVVCYQTDGTQIFVYRDNTTTAGVDTLDVARVHALWLQNHSGSEIRGLVISRFSGNGIFIDHGGNHKIMGNYIGTDETGTLGGTAFGDYIVQDPNTGWLIRDDTPDGTVTYGNGYPEAPNQIPNLAGTDVYTPSVYSGVMMSASSNNQIGDFAADDRNIISSNAGNGVRILGAEGSFVYAPYDGSNGNVIKGNFTGTGPMGNESIGNFNVGIQDFSPAGAFPLAYKSNDNVVIGNLSSSNVFGISVNRSKNNLIAHNLIGTDVTGLVAVPNELDGSVLQGVAQVTVKNNLIVSTGEDLIEYLGVEGGLIQNNILGANKNKEVNDPTFGSATSNGIVGVNHPYFNAPGFRIASQDVQIKDNFVANTPLFGIVNMSDQNLLVQGNTVIRNGIYGIWMSNEVQNAQVLDNHVGIDPNNPTDSSNGNGRAGISAGSWTSMIAFLPPPFIPNHEALFIFFGLVEGPKNVLIKGNTIAYNQEGVLITGEHDNEVTNYCLAFPPCINARFFVDPFFPPFQPLALPYDNGLDGDAKDIAILGNSIHSNGPGIGIDLSVATGLDSISRNPLLATGFPDGVTLNDGGDVDGGPNDLQNYPDLDESEVDASGNHLKKVVGTLDSPPGLYRIEFFVNESDDPSGHGQGQKFAGFVEMTITNDPASKTFTLTCSGIDPANGCLKVDVPTPLQHLNVTSTATKMNPDGEGGYVPGATSEFSANVPLK